MSADQLLAKALSTDSEDEAIACLKMARKLTVDFCRRSRDNILSE